MDEYKLSSAAITKLTRITSQTDPSQSDELYLPEEVGSKRITQIEEEHIPDVSITSTKLVGVDFTDKEVAKVYDELSRNKSNFLNISEISDNSGLSYRAVESALDNLSAQNIVLNKLEDASSLDDRTNLNMGSEKAISPTSYALDQSVDMVEIIELLSELKSTQNFEQRLSILGLFLENPEAVWKKSRIISAVDMSEDTVTHHLIQLRKKGIISKIRRPTTKTGYKLNATSDDAKWLFSSYE
jgi:DNA-binding transcriptional ArsR family regulator